MFDISTVNRNLDVESEVLDEKKCVKKSALGQGFCSLQATRLIDKLVVKRESGKLKRRQHKPH